MLFPCNYALYQSKEQGRNRVFCTSNEQLGMDKISETSDLMHLINDALETDKIVLFFQPIVNISSGEITHHEALMRIVMDSGDLLILIK